MNFKNYMYCNKNHLDTRPSCKVYHDKKRKHAVFTEYDEKELAEEFNKFLNELDKE